ncbi:MAG: cytochrome b N-terminal domain-containing protein [Ahniella sp.]|nr:cytochrome b N-terminal domain-containing protein [Ahniella sp.]
MIRLIQLGLKFLFLRVESGWNRVFGDRLNPFYHLGAIVFWLFWIVAGSGLYLYAMFETSVADAYRSMEVLSREQWYFGGILRSLHRYASDGMVVLMVVHMVRHFAFDRLSGFRGFSWLTGVVLIALTYASAINGFMLPWDRLAQYVTTTTFEWLEWLPGLGGTLARNVLSPAQVSDRFFSLLSFLHIGLPLFVLLLMWVHVQRVPKARTMPPKPIAWGLLAAFVVFSTAVPVLSQGGPAALELDIQSIQLDWILLGPLPLMEILSPAWSFGILAALFVLLLSLPWLCRSRGQRAREFQILFQPGGHLVMARADETVLEAGLRAGLDLPYECRNGACGLCRCSVREGEVDQPAEQATALGAAHADPRQILMCCSRPRADLQLALDVPEIAIGGQKPIRRSLVEVVRMDRLNPGVMRLLLVPPEREPPFEFRAGQYLNVILADGQRRAFSFANPPHERGRIELHIRLIPGGRFTTHVFDHMQVGDRLDIEAPLGRFTLHTSQRPILLIAGATGFAPIKSIIEDALHRHIDRPMFLYWGVRHSREFYQQELLDDWHREHPGFKPILVVSGDEDPEWTGRRGLVHEVLLADFPDLTGHEAYVCGSVAMVQAALPEFLAHGLPIDACFTDAFHPGLHSA